MIARLIGLAGAGLLLASCSEAAPDAAEAARAEAPAALSPGQYEARWTVASLQSTDQSTPATTLTADATGTAKACVTADGKIDAAIFAEGEDTCSQSSSYVRGGRISVQQSCTRPGKVGSVMQSIDGSSSADRFEAEVSTSTFLDGAGDYRSVRKLSAKRVGDCPAEEAKS